LSALQHDVATGPAGTAAGRSALDPRVGLASSVVRANSDFVAPFAYGLLEEAAALGLAHEQVARSLATLVVDLEGLIRAIKARVASGAANYSEADASVLSAVNRAGDVDGSGYGSGSGSSTGLSSGSGHGSSSSGDWSFLA
jgi:hypothetical protein